MTHKKLNRMVKTPDDIARIREGGALLASIVADLVSRVAPGIATDTLDRVAERAMYDMGGRPAFKGYRPHGVIIPFATTLCACVNDEVVHAPAIPGKILREGDIFSIDIGMVYKDRYTDMAVTVPVGKVDAASERLIEVTRRSLYDGLAAIMPGKTLRGIGKAVQRTVEHEGFSVVRALVGHGVGYAIHEQPPVPNYDDPAADRVTLRPGMVLAVEPMVCAGSSAVYQKEDGWTIVSSDHSRSAHFEHTVVVTETGYEILTTI